MLTVAKNLNTPSWGNGRLDANGQPLPSGYFTIPQQNEPVRPIDPGAWVRHTNACRALPSILEGSEGALTPTPGQFRPPSSGTAVSGNSGSGLTQSGPESQALLHHGPTNDYLRDETPLSVEIGPAMIAKRMARRNSGLYRCDRTWLKVSVLLSHSY